VQSYGHEDKDRERFGERVEQAFGTAVRASASERSWSRW